MCESDFHRPEVETPTPTENPDKTVNFEESIHPINETNDINLERIREQISEINEALTEEKIELLSHDLVINNLNREIELLKAQLDTLEQQPLFMKFRNWIRGKNPKDFIKNQINNYEMMLNIAETLWNTDQNANKPPQDNNESIDELSKQQDPYKNIDITDLDDPWKNLEEDNAQLFLHFCHNILICEFNQNRDNLGLRLYILELTAKLQIKSPTLYKFANQYVQQKRFNSLEELHKSSPNMTKRHEVTHEQIASAATHTFLKRQSQENSPCWFGLPAFPIVDIEVPLTASFGDMMLDNLSNASNKAIIPNPLSPFQKEKTSTTIKIQDPFLQTCKDYLFLNQGNIITTEADLSPEQTMNRILDEPNNSNADTTKTEDALEDIVQTNNTVQALVKATNNNDRSTQNPQILRVIHQFYGRVVTHPKEYLIAYNQFRSNN